MACYRSFGAMLLLVLAAVAANKIAYKKPLYGKLSYTKEKYFKARATSSLTTTESDWPGPMDLATPLLAEHTESSSTMRSTNASLELPQETIHKGSSTTTTMSAKLDNTLPTPPTPTTAMPVAKSNLPVPCTCGVFLSSQIQSGQLDVPLINNEMDRTFACNAIGRKQCQTKCLEVIVQHLPNSANIVCATLGHDCHKERAYLFIKNCHNQWVNTNLQAGREYCCKEGVSYRCPLLG